MSLDDIKAILHPAGTFPQADRYTCERNPDCIGDVPGIPVLAGAGIAVARARGLEARS